MKQLCTLRGHREAISSLQVLEVNDNVTFISSDDAGWIVWWNLNLKKPLGVWRGHENTVITIKQIGSYVMTQSKDACIKFWNLLDTKVGLRTDFAAGKDAFPVPEHHTIPFNSLNFCNVDYMAGNLITPALEDSNCFDVYSVELDPFDIHKQLTVNPGKLFAKTFGNDTKDFGIVMRLLYIEPAVIFAGFESGHVIGFRVHGENVSIAYTNDFHKPSPILSMEYNDGKLLVGSARKKLTVHQVEEVLLGRAEDQVKVNDISELEEKPHNQSKLSQVLTVKQKTPGKAPSRSGGSVKVLMDSDVSEHNVKHGGVHLIASYKKLIIAGFWNGLFKGFDWDFRTVIQFESKLPRVSNLTSNISSEKPDTNYNNKLTEILAYEPKSAAVVPGNSYKLRAMNRTVITNKTLLLAGYGDGKILVFEIDQEQYTGPGLAVASSGG